MVSRGVEFQVVLMVFLSFVKSGDGVLLKRRNNLLPLWGKVLRGRSEDEVNKSQP